MKSKMTMLAIALLMGGYGVLHWFHRGAQSAAPMTPGHFVAVPLSPGFEMKWLEPGPAGLDVKALLSRARADEPEHFHPVVISDRETAFGRLYRTVNMVAVPRVGYEDAEYFYFSGGTATYPIDDFSSGFAITKATGKILEWPSLVEAKENDQNNVKGHEFTAGSPPPPAPPRPPSSR